MCPQIFKHKEEVMKKLITLVVGVAFLVMSACTQKVDTEAEKAKVKTVLDQYVQASKTEDMELVSKIMAHDADMVNFGTDAAERLVGWEALKEVMQKSFAATENSKLSVKDQAIKVHDSGKVAWFSEIFDCIVVSQGKEVKLEGLRFTGVLEKRNGNWVIVQSHLSVPVSGQLIQY